MHKRRSFILVKISLRMRSCRAVKTSDSQCRTRNCPGSHPSILQHSGIGGRPVKQCLNKVLKKYKKTHRIISSPHVVREQWLNNFEQMLYIFTESEKQSLIGLHAHSFSQPIIARAPPPHSVSFSLIYCSYTRALLVSQNRRHLFVTL